MKAKQSLICLMMTLLITAGLIIGIKADTSAASELPNVTLSNDGLLSWDIIKTADFYHLLPEGGNGGYLKIDGSYSFGGCCTYKADKIEFNLQKYFDDNGNYKDGIQKVTVSAYQGNEFLGFESTVEYDYTCSLPKLATPANLTWNGKIISWDAVPDCKLYYGRVYEVKDGVSKCIWLESANYQTTSLDTSLDSSTTKAVKYDEDCDYYFTVIACDYASGRKYKDSDYATSETVSGSQFIKDQGTSGKCKWIYNSDKKRLTISGPEIMDYSLNQHAPWSKYGNDIYTIVLKDGITRIGDYAFEGCNIDSITIPDSVISIGERAFFNCYSLFNVNLGKGLLGIEAEAFLCDENGTAKLKKITIPENVRFIATRSIGYIKKNEIVTYAVSDFEISGKCGSEAFKYAKENNLNWKSTEHVWDEGIIDKDPDCKETGVKIYSCDCGETRQETIDLTSHSLTKVDARAANETEDGNKEYYVCSVCGKWFEDAAGTKEITDHDSVIIPKETKTATPTATVTPAATATATPTTATSAPTTVATATPAATAAPTTAATATPSAATSTTPAVTTTVTPTPGSDIATPADDGTVITDVDGSKYYVAEKVTVSQLAKKLAVADKTTGGKYKITGLTRKGKKITGGTVSFIKPYDSTAAIVNVPATVKIAGLKFKVTEIAAKACKGNTSIKSVTIGKNVKKIGANAFNGCTNLSKIKIKTTKLTKKTVGKNAFKNINKKAVAGVPKSKRKLYKQVLKAKGMKAKTQKIK